VAGGQQESTKTVWVAIAANAAIALVKAVAGVIGGSSALVAEAAHSVADTSNQGLLLVSLHRSERPPDEEHPFGYGKERFFWVLLAAVFMFVAGGIFGILEGLYRIFRESGGSEGGYVWSYGALGFATVAEGTSWVRAIRQTRGEARDAGLGLVRYLRVSKEPAVKTVASEDTAALIGIAVAFAGVGLHQVTGNVVWDGAAAVAIGVLLCVVGIVLARDTKGLLIGESARRQERERLEQTILRHDEVEDVLELLTMYLGPQNLLVAARLDLRDDVPAGEIEELSSQIEQELREAMPDVTHVFLDATPGRSARRRPVAAD
jgi:cation diffusion facilitator family transporter